MEKITQDSYKLYINGQWIDASDGATFQTRCPANGEGLATCAQATREDVDQAVDAAWAAFRSWKTSPPTSGPPSSTGSPISSTPMPSTWP